MNQIGQIATGEPDDHFVCERCGTVATTALSTLVDDRVLRLALCEDCWMRERVVIGRTGIMVEGLLRPVEDWQEVEQWLAIVERYTAPRAREDRANLRLMAAEMRVRSAHLEQPMPATVAAFLAKYGSDEG